MGGWEKTGQKGEQRGEPQDTVQVQGRGRVLLSVPLIRLLGEQRYGQPWPVSMALHGSLWAKLRYQMTFSTPAMSSFPGHGLCLGPPPAFPTPSLASSSGGPQHRAAWHCGASPVPAVAMEHKGAQAMETACRDAALASMGPTQVLPGASEMKSEEAVLPTTLGAPMNLWPLPDSVPRGGAGLALPDASHSLLHLCFPHAACKSTSLGVDLILLPTSFHH